MCSSAFIYSLDLLDKSSKMWYNIGIMKGRIDMNIGIPKSIEAVFIGNGIFLEDFRQMEDGKNWGVSAAFQTSLGYRHEEQIVFDEPNAVGLRAAIRKFAGQMNAEKIAAGIHVDNYDQQWQGGTVGRGISVWDIQKEVQEMIDALRKSADEMPIYDFEGSTMWLDGEHHQKEEYVVDDNYTGFVKTVLYDGKCPYTQKTKDEYLAEGCKVLSERDYTKMVDEFLNNLCGEWSEISQSQYDEALDVLPPLAWKNGGFFCREADTHNVHAFYQELNGKYYTSLQRTSTPRDEILQSLHQYIEDQKKEKHPVDKE